MKDSLWYLRITGISKVVFEYLYCQITALDCGVCPDVVAMMTGRQVIMSGRVAWNISLDTGGGLGGQKLQDHRQSFGLNVREMSPQFISALSSHLAGHW